MLSKHAASSRKQRGILDPTALRAASRRVSSTVVPRHRGGVTKIRCIPNSAAKLDPLATSQTSPVEKESKRPTAAQAKSKKSAFSLADGDRDTTPTPGQISGSRANPRGRPSTPTLRAPRDCACRLRPRPPWSGTAGMAARCGCSRRLLRGRRAGT
jgi:hypothetical protein